MARKRIEVEPGSGDVFADLGYSDARERRLKVELAVEVNRALRAHGITQTQAARRLAMLQPHVSDLVHYRLNRFSVERLLQFLALLGKDVEIRIKKKRTGRRRMQGVRIHAT